MQSCTSSSFSFCVLFLSIFFPVGRVAVEVTNLHTERLYIYLQCDHVWNRTLIYYFILRDTVVSRDKFIYTYLYIYR